MAHSMHFIKIHGKQKKLEFCLKNNFFLFEVKESIKELEMTLNAIDESLEFIKETN